MTTNNDDTKKHIIGNIGINGVKSESIYGQSLLLEPGRGTRKIKDRLSMERWKALNTLQKSQIANNVEGSNNENVKDFNHTEFITYVGGVSSFNISSFITDETIGLERSPCSSSTSKKAKISFDPNEITGRSTQHMSDLSENRPSMSPLTSLPFHTIDEIISSSFAPKARGFSGTLRECETKNKDRTSQTRIITKSSVPTCDFANKLKLDSKLKITSPPMIADEKLSLQSDDAFTDSNLNSENFKPSELMDSKLLTDEISWAQEFATIPAVALSKPAKSKSNINYTSGTDSITLHTGLSFDSNNSLGKYFNTRSDKILNMIEDVEEDNNRTPIALIQEDDIINATGALSSKERAKNLDMTSSIAPSTTLFKSPPIQRANIHTHTNECGRSENHESKDSGNVSDNSFVLGMTAIDKALCKLDINAVDTKKLRIANELHDHAKRVIAAPQAKRGDDTDILLKCSQHHGNCDNKDVDRSLENKENLDPNTSANGCIGDEDTISFTESVLNSTDMAHLHENTPAIPLIKITEACAYEADNEDWTPTPRKSFVRRVRRTKSPNNSVDVQSVSDAAIANLAVDSTVEKRDAAIDCNLNVVDSVKTTANIGCQSPSESIIGYENNTIHVPRSYPSNAGGGSTTHNNNGGNIGVGIIRKMNLSPTMSNHSSTVAPLARSHSRNSNASEFSHRDGKMIPIKLTCLELSWHSIKLRTNVQKSMQVKNTSNKRLVVRIAVSGPGFQIVNMQKSNATLTLQPQECHSIIVNFCPTVVGVALGVLSFYAPQGATSPGANNAPFLQIPLYGYGGNARIMPYNVCKGPIGAAFIPLGDLSDLAAPLTQELKIYNRGDLPGFAMIVNDVVDVTMPHLCDAIKIEPRYMLIAPGGCALVHIEFRPRREDIRKIVRKISTVLTLANMRITCGEEASRQRLRQLFERMTPHELSKMPSQSLERLRTRFPNEIEMPELRAFKEQSDVFMDLLCSLRIHEVALTLNNDNLNETMDVSSSCFLPNCDDTILFRTVCLPCTSDSPSDLEPVDELQETLKHANNDEHCYTVSSTTSSSKCLRWTVQPRSIAFDCRTTSTSCARGDGGTDGLRRSLQIINGYETRKYFEIDCDHKNILHFTPMEGYVEPNGGHFDVQLRLRRKRLTSMGTSGNIIITIYVDNDCIDVPVKILHLSRGEE